MRLASAAAFVVLGLAPSAIAQAPAFSNDPAKQPAGVYKVDPTHASVTARLTHLGFSKYTFQLRAISGDVTLNPANVAASKVSVTIDPASVDTGLPDFDKEIGGTFFGGKPITFVSRTVAGAGTSMGKVTGDLTLNGVTKPVTLDVVFNGGGPAFMSKLPTLGFSAKGTIKRSDFNVAPQLPAMAVSDDVELLIEAEFQKS